MLGAHHLACRIPLGSNQLHRARLEVRVHIGEERWIYWIRVEELLWRARLGRMGMGMSARAIVRMAVRSSIV